MDQVKTKFGIADRASTSFVWTFFQFMSSKLASVIGQIVLAWLLVPEDFGYVGLAHTVVAFAAILQKFGLRDVLVQRNKNIHIWENAAFWLSLIIGTASAIVMAAAAPLAASFYDEPKLVGIVLVLALAFGIDSISMVPAAKLQSQMRFRTLSLANGVTAILGVVSSVILAYFGFGAYSIVLPRPIVTLVKTVWFFRSAQSNIRLDMDTRLWKYLIGNASVLLLTYVLVTITSYGDYMILGKLYGAGVVGMYYFAFNLSTQTFNLLAVNVSNVLLPALSQLRRDPKRQIDAFERAARTLTAVGMPICAIQAAAAEPMVHIFFNPKWYPSIPLLQILSLGIGFRIVVLPSTSLIKSQGRFLTLLFFFVVASLVFLSAAYIGATQYENMGTAVAVAIYSAVLGYSILAVAMSPASDNWRRALMVFLMPFVTTCLAVVPSYFVAQMVPEIPGQHWIRLFIIVAMSGILYVPLMKPLMPQTADELLTRFAGLSARFKDIRNRTN